MTDTANAFDAVTAATGAIAPDAGEGDDAPEATQPIAIQVGDRFISRGRLAAQAMYWLAWLAFSRRANVSTGVQRELDALGFGALRLTLAAGFLVGIIVSLQVATQLSLYSADAITPRAVGWFAARELGPLVAALLVVARSASAIAGELAAMSAGAELDALRAMGLDPVKYLVAPKLAALLVALPALTVLADGLITLGAWVSATLVVGMSTWDFVEEFHSALSVRDLAVGLGKSVLFAFVIAVIPCDEGLQAGRAVGSIGRAATRAVVHSLVAVLAVDTAVNAVFYFIPGLI